MFTTLAKSVAVSALALLLAALPLRAAEVLSPEQTKAVEKIVQDYLMAHPEVILQAVEAMQQREAAEAKAKTIGFLKTYGKDLRRDPNSYVAGNPEGDVTLVEFFDYRCGYCKKFHPVMAELLKTDKNIRVVLKEFPILGPQSKLATVAAIAALRLDPTKYYGFHNALMTARGELNLQTIQDIAGEAGLEAAALGKAMRDPEIERIVARNYRMAKSLGINGTPGFVIGDTIVPGYISLAQVRDLIDEARANCTTC